MRRYFVMVPRDGVHVIPRELREEEARARHEAGEDVHFSDGDGPLTPVPRAVAEDATEEPAPKAKKAKG